jgi:hypothetical protein
MVPALRIVPTVGPVSSRTNSRANGIWTGRADGKGGCVSHESKQGIMQSTPFRRALAGAGFAAVLLSPDVGAAQPINQKMPTQAVQTPVPGTRFDPPPGAVVDDPNRVFGDEGPFFAALGVVGALGLTPSASLSVQYDNNVARLEDGEPLPSRFRSKADWSFRPNFGLATERNIGRQRLFLNGSVGRIIYANNTQLNNNRFNIGGGIGLSLGRSCGGQVSAGYNKRDWLIGGFDEAANATAETTTFGGTVNCATAAGLSGGIGYNRGRQTNKSEDPAVDRSFADARFQGVTGNIGYRVGSRGQVGVSTAWNENILPNQTILGEENRNTITNFAVFGSYRIGSTLSANGSIGQSRVRSSLPGSEGFTGGTWNFGGSYAGSRFGANFRFAQSVNGGGNQAANFAVVRDFLVSGTYRLNDRMNISAGYNRFDQDFRGTNLVPQTNQIENFSGDRLFAGAGYRFARVLSLRGDVNYQRRDSQPAGFGFDSTTATLTIVGRF